MNNNLVDIVKKISAEYGEAVLSDPRRLKAFFSDLAKEEPKPLRIAFGRCIEEGAYAALKGAPDAAERTERKTLIAQKVHDEHGLDMGLCNEALDILEAALPPAMPEEKAAALPAGEGQTQNTITNGEGRSEEILGLHVTIAEKNEELIRCIQNIERLTEAKNQALNEIRDLRKTTTEKSEELIRCEQEINRLTREKSEALEERERAKSGRTGVIWLGIIAIAISIGIAYYKYQEMEGAYYGALGDYSQIKSDYDSLSSDHASLVSDHAELNSAYDKLKADYDKRGDTDRLRAENNRLSSAYNQLNSAYNKSKNLWAITVTKLQVGNSSNGSQWITGPGGRLVSANMRYLQPVITVDSLLSGELTFFVKIINPSGTLDRNTATSPSGYTHSSIRQISRANSQTITLSGWGNADTSHYSAGEWTVEVWYKDVCLRSEKVKIY